MSTGVRMYVHWQWQSWCTVIIIRRRFLNEPAWRDATIKTATTKWNDEGKRVRERERTLYEHVEHKWESRFQIKVDTLIRINYNFIIQWTNMTILFLMARHTTVFRLLCFERLHFGFGCLDDKTNRLTIIIATIKQTNKKGTTLTTERNAKTLKEVTSQL